MDDQDKNRNRRGEFATALLFAAAITLVSFAAGLATHRLLEWRRAQVAAQPLGVFWEVWDLLDRGFYGELPSADERTYGAVRGVLDLLDQYTIFLEPQPTEVERDRLSGAYAGIGVDLWRDAEGFVVLSPYPDSPARAAGVLTGDRLLAVDARDVLTGTLDQIRVWLRGEVGTPVTVTLSRPPTPPFDVTIAREEIYVPTVSYRLVDQDPTIGYLQISSFGERTLTETAAALDSLLADDVSRLVLDLRDNGGGLIAPAVEVADMFLDDGAILIEQRRGEEEIVTQATAGGAAVEMPVIVLVNHSTASAAEILAGAIQSRARGILLGEATYGKGSVQLIFGLSDGSSLHVTSAVWLLPNRQPVEPDGLTPDMVIARADELTDSQLDRAIQYLMTGE
jgi:carboxyl-terminal processing protease